MEIGVGLISGTRVAKNHGSNVAARLLTVELTDSTDTQTVQLVEQFGEESNPVPGSMVVVLNGGGGFKLGVGVAGPTAPVMPAGGKRLYSVDPATAVVKAEIRLDPDGSVTISNDSAAITMSPTGEVSITAPAIILDGDVTVTGSLTATGDVLGAGKSLSLHTHGGVTPGTGATGVPV